MVSGTIATVVSLLALSWCREIVGFSARSMGLETTSDGSRSSLIVFAVLWVYILDFSINTGMSQRLNGSTNTEEG